MPNRKTIITFERQLKGRVHDRTLASLLLCYCYDNVLTAAQLRQTFTRALSRVKTNEKCYRSFSPENIQSIIAVGSLYNLEIIICDKTSRKPLFNPSLSGLDKRQVHIQYNGHTKLFELINRLDTYSAEFACYFCLKTFSTKSNQLRHLATCRTRKAELLSLDNISDYVRPATEVLLFVPIVILFYCWSCYYIFRWINVVYAWLQVTYKVGPLRNKETLLTRLCQCGLVLTPEIQSLLLNNKYIVWDR